jgi:predicted DNA-binding protein
MSNTKVRKKLNDTVLAIRLPTIIRDQLEIVAHAQYKNSSELVRELIVTKVREATQYIQPQSQPVKTKTGNSVWDAMSPAERKAYDEEWN